MAKTPSDYILGIILFTFIIVGGVSLIAMMQTQNANFATGKDFEDFNQSFNQLDAVTHNVQDLNRSVSNLDTNPGDFGTLNALIQSGWNTLSLLTSSLSFMNTAFTGMTKVFGVPWWIPTLISAMIIVIIIFAIFAAIFQRQL